MQADSKARRYDGYSKPRDLSPDTELTQVGRGTPCGELMRRYWHPIALASELTDVPMPVRLLGEDLVLFRDLSGRLGLLHRHCSHRGTSLEFGIVSTHGLRCCYHGWLFDVDGTILETPGEPATSRIRQTTSHGAYPVQELAGLVFAYLGPSESMPELPRYDVYDEPDNEMLPYRIPIPCNWLQVHENAMDPIHTVFLHTLVSGTQLADAWGALPIIEWQAVPGGMIYTTTRRWGEHVWVRSNDVFLPNIAQAGALWEDGAARKGFTRASLTRWLVPLDDTSAMTIGWRHFNQAVDPKGLGVRAQVGVGSVDFIGQTDERSYQERQRQPGDYDAEVSQRPIAVHGYEHLGSTDQGIAMLRRLTRRAIRAVAAGEQPPRSTGPTYVHDSVLRIPVRGNDDAEALRQIGREVTKLVVESAQAPDRRAAVLAGLAAIEQRWTAG